MIECCNSLCPNGSWFHWSCADPVITSAIENDWYCCDSCEDSEGYVYCMCRRKLAGEMVQCELGDTCKRHIWYHLACLGKTSTDDLPGVI